VILFTNKNPPKAKDAGATECLNMEEMQKVWATLRTLRGLPENTSIPRPLGDRDTKLFYSK